MDGLTTGEEVSAADNTALKGSVEAKVFVSKPNSPGQKMATVANNRLLTL